MPPEKAGILAAGDCPGQSLNFDRGREYSGVTILAGARSSNALGFVVYLLVGVK